MNKEEQNYTLIMAAVVAMVAVVGLVMWQEGNVSGAANVQFMHPEPLYRSQTLPVYQADQYSAGMKAGEEAAVTCGGIHEEVECCKNVCAAQPTETSRSACASHCRLRTAQIHTDNAFARN